MVVLNFQRGHQKCKLTSNSRLFKLLQYLPSSSRLRRAATAACANWIASLYRCGQAIMKLSPKALVVEGSYGAICLLWRLGQKFYGFYCRYNLLLHSVFSCPTHVTFVPYLENPFIFLFQKKAFETFVVLSNPHASSLINLFTTCWINTCWYDV